MIGLEQDAMGTNQSAGSKKKGKEKGKKGAGKKGAGKKKGKKGGGKEKEKKGEERREETKGEGRKEYDWKYVHVIAELKCVRGLMDLNPKVVLQLAGYARHVFHRQSPVRPRLHGYQLHPALLGVRALRRIRFQLG